MKKANPDRFLNVPLTTKELLYSELYTSADSYLDLPHVNRIMVIKEFIPVPEVIHSSV